MDAKLAFTGHAVLEMLEIDGKKTHIHLYTPRAGTDNTLWSKYVYIYRFLPLNDFLISQCKV